jgi:hypothetical protein
MLDDDLADLDRAHLVEEVRRLRAGIRAHRDATGQDLCWYHPDLWGLLPERVEPAVAVPPWPEFMAGCVRYRESLERLEPTARPPRSSS